MVIPHSGFAPAEIVNAFKAYNHFLFQVHQLWLRVWPAFQVFGHGAKGVRQVQGQV